MNLNWEGDDDDEDVQAAEYELKLILEIHDSESELSKQSKFKTLLWNLTLKIERSKRRWDSLEWPGNKR